jgi:hypothetical protein
MSPHERRQFAVNFTWSWPAVLVLLVLAMLPIWGPLLPPLEGAIAPVTSKVTFIQQTPAEGGMTVRMSYTKLRDCEILGVSLDRNGVPIEFVPISGSVDTLVTRGTGPQISRQWFIGSDNLDGLRLRWIHRCNPLFTTITIAYP